MSSSFIDEPMIEAFVYETSQITENLEQLVIANEKSGTFNEEAINEIFRFMHTIKGSSAMMMFNEMSTLAHRLEDIFYIIREDKTVQYDFTILIDIILESMDYFKIELMKIKEGDPPDGENATLLQKVTDYLEVIKTKDKGVEKIVEDKHQKNYAESNYNESDYNYYKARIWFKKDAEMENIRAYTVIHNITDLVEEVVYEPKDIIENDNCVSIIQSNGFFLVVKTVENEEVIKKYLENTIFLERLNFETIDLNDYNSFESIEKSIEKSIEMADEIKIPKTPINSQQSIISVQVDKLDKLMDMVGELVIAEAMVTQNPELTQLEIESFEKASRQLHKITGELQDMVMAIRMVPLSTTFMKMHRIVRDMTRRLGKDIELVVLGEETEVDKNIIEKIADPLMHIIRNSIDHGIEDKEERSKNGKSTQGTIRLEAKNSGSDVQIIIKDDGKGLNKKKLYDKAIKNGLINSSLDEMSDRDVYNLILQPGFSTKEEVTEFSGRGVGMDVVAKNISSIGGTVIVDSIPKQGMSIILKIPLTLAIIEGMNIKVGNSRFTLPIVNIKESFRPKNKEIIKDTEGQEMIMVRGRCYPIIRLHQFYSISTEIMEVESGILIMVEEGEKSCCVFADELLGQQQVVVKGLPEYIKKSKQIKGLGGCTLLGDGSISLILDVGEFNNLSNVSEKL
jgi:two-component system chemotaxis sensor kinase CheA